MTKGQLYHKLNYVDHSRKNQLKYANLIITIPELIAPLLEILFTVDAKISCRAVWVFEFLCGERLEAIIPHLDRFTENIAQVHLDSAVQPVAKICEYLTKAYYDKYELLFKNHLT